MTEKQCPITIDTKNYHVDTSYHCVTTKMDPKKETVKYTCSSVGTTRVELKKGASARSAVKFTLMPEMKPMKLDLQPRADPCEAVERSIRASFS